MSSIIKWSSICSLHATNDVSKCLLWRYHCYAVSHCFLLKTSLNIEICPSHNQNPPPRIALLLAPSVKGNCSCLLFLTVCPGQANMLNLEAIRCTVELDLHCECKCIPLVGQRQVIVPLRDKFNECSYLWVCIWFQPNCYSPNVCALLCYSGLLI